MRVMVFVKATEDNEEGLLHDRGDGGNGEI